MRRDSWTEFYGPSARVAAIYNGGGDASAHVDADSSWMEYRKLWSFCRSPEANGQRTGSVALGTELDMTLSVRVGGCEASEGAFRRPCKCPKA